MIDERDERWQMKEKDGRLRKGICQKEGHKETGIMERWQMKGDGIMTKEGHKEKLIMKRWQMKGMKDLAEMEER